MRDTRVHCLLYFISPYGRGLKPLDLEVMKKLSTKVNLVPVIAKADGLTKTEIKNLKARILEELDAAEIRTYQLPEVDSDETPPRGGLQLFSVCGANALVEVGGKMVRARQYPWGTVEVENPEHCDFVKLRRGLVRQIQNMQDVTHDIHYKAYAALELKPFQRVAQEMKKRRDSNESNFNNNFL